MRAPDKVATGPRLDEDEPVAKGVEALLYQESTRVPLQSHCRHVNDAVPSGLQLLVDILFHEELRQGLGMVGGWEELGEL